MGYYETCSIYQKYYNQQQKGSKGKAWQGKGSAGPAPPASAVQLGGTNWGNLGSVPNQSMIPPMVGKGLMPAVATAGGPVVRGPPMIAHAKQPMRGMVQDDD